MGKYKDTYKYNYKCNEVCDKVTVFQEGNQILCRMQAISPAHKIKKIQMQKETQRQCKDKDNVNTNTSSKLHVARFLKGNRRLQMQAHQIK